jgi:hypothetical protein
LNVEVGPKRLELLHEVVPSATSMALLVNPTNPSIAEPFSRAMYGSREFVVAGGLISYGTSLIETYRQVGSAAANSSP